MVNPWNYDRKLCRPAGFAWLVAFLLLISAAKGNAQVSITGLSLSAYDVGNGVTLAGLISQLETINLVPGWTMSSGEEVAGNVVLPSWIVETETFNVDGSATVTVSNNLPGFTSGVVSYTLGGKSQTSSIPLLPPDLVVGYVEQAPYTDCAGNVTTTAILPVAELDNLLPGETQSFEIGKP